MSDLHLGGTRGAPIFRQSQEFAGLVESLAKRDARHGGSIGLVINGDFIDILAEDVPGYVARPQDAEQAVSQILAYADFGCIWQKLQSFVERDKHKLIVIGGNHDLETAYPNVQEQFLQHLAQDDGGKRGRILFAISGTGYRCCVGHATKGFASVLCVHGNEFDNWNAVSPESIARLVRAATLGIESPLTSEPPNAGTRLVKDVMNAVKQDWPFVDLLKPEVDTVFNVLLALDPKRAAALGGVIKALGKAETEGAGRVRRVLGRPMTELPQAGTSVDAQWKPGANFAEFLGNDTNGRLSLDQIWALAGQDDTTPEDIAGEESQQILGGGRVLWNWLDFSVRRIFADPCKALRAALADWGGGPKTWDLDGACDVYDKLAELKPDADVVVAGHTHLRRQKLLPAIGPRQRQPLYLNTGTWARLMRLTETLLNSDKDFAVFWNALQAKSMQALDSLPSDVMLNQPTVAVICPHEKQATVKAALCEYGKPSDPKQEAFALVEKATWSTVGNA